MPCLASVLPQVEMRQETLGPEESNVLSAQLSVAPNLSIASRLWV